MRINQYVARATGLSRRAADQLIADGRIGFNDKPAATGTQINDDDTVTLDGAILTVPDHATTIMLHKSVGYVCSRRGQGSQTIYELLPTEYHSLKPIGRLDKDSSGLLLLTNDGQLANQLTHPRYAKEKVYEVTLDKPLTDEHRALLEQGVMLDDGLSRLRVETRDTRHETRSPQRGSKPRDSEYVVRLSEGRNRQVRHTFAALGYEVQSLHRTSFGSYRLGTLQPGSYREISTEISK